MFCFSASLLVLLVVASAAPAVGIAGSQQDPRGIQQSSVPLACPGMLSAADQRCPSTAFFFFPLDCSKERICIFALLEHFLNKEVRCLSDETLHFKFALFVMQKPKAHIQWCMFQRGFLESICLSPVEDETKCFGISFHSVQWGYILDLKVWGSN